MPFGYGAAVAVALSRLQADDPRRAARLIARLVYAEEAGMAAAGFLRLRPGLWWFAEEDIRIGARERRGRLVWIWMVVAD
jgi:hypothetical protein